MHSLRKAINDKCKECLHDPVSGWGTWRQQVDGCTSYECPLYHVRPRSRPYSGRGDAKKANQTGLDSTISPYPIPM